MQPRDKSAVPPQSRDVTARSKCRSSYCKRDECGAAPRAVSEWSAPQPPCWRPSPPRSGIDRSPKVRRRAPSRNRSRRAGASRRFRNPCRRYRGDLGRYRSSGNSGPRGWRRHRSRRGPLWADPIRGRQRLRRDRFGLIGHDREARVDAGVDDHIEGRTRARMIGLPPNRIACGDV